MGGGDIHRDTRISRLAEAWLEDITEEGRLAPRTIDRYKDSVNCAILPALGNLHLYEASLVSRLDRFLKTIAKDHPSKARHAKNVLGQMYGYAVRHDALPTNPVREVGRLRKRRRHVRALTVEDLEKVRAAIGRWLTPTPGKPGPRRSNDLAEIIDMLLATGARIGEILALRVATLIDQQVDTKAAAAQLGHASENITATYYIAKTHIAPDIGDVLEKLGPRRVPPSLVGQPGSTQPRKEQAVPTPPRLLIYACDRPWCVEQPSTVSAKTGSLWEADSSTA